MEHRMEPNKRNGTPHKMNGEFAVVKHYTRQRWCSCSPAFNHEIWHCPKGLLREVGGALKHHGG